MIDVTLPSDFPIDLARVCQPGAKVYFLKSKEFGTITKFMNTVEIKLDQGKSSSTKVVDREDFIEQLLSDEVVAKSRVVFPSDDNKPLSIKPRPKPKAGAVVTPPSPKLVDAHGQEVKVDSFGRVELSPISAPAPKVEEKLLTGYIDEKTGKFSKTLQPGMIEINYRKVTRKVALELDSVQLQKLKELGIITE